MTQTLEYAAPAMAIAMRHRLGLRTNTLCFDVRLGCSSFLFGLSLVYSFVHYRLSPMLLRNGDVASRMGAPDDRTITLLMGDAGAAALIERRATESFFQL